MVRPSDVIGVFAGLHTQDGPTHASMQTAKTFGNELKRIGWQGDEVAGARKMHAFFELHIEQGADLMRAKTSALSPMAKVFHGLKLRSSARMPIRDPHQCPCKNVAMARILGQSRPDSRRTHRTRFGAAGHIDVFPNSRNVIPARSLQSTSALDLSAHHSIWKRLRNRSVRQSDAGRD
jgi:N-carbamoyl-L-amino-acid hydrolase